MSGGQGCRFPLQAILCGVPSHGEHIAGGVALWRIGDADDSSETEGPGQLLNNFFAHHCFVWTARCMPLCGGCFLGGITLRVTAELKIRLSTLVSSSSMSCDPRDSPSSSDGSNHSSLEESSPSSSDKDNHENMIR